MKKTVMLMLQTAMELLSEFYFGDVQAHGTDNCAVEVPTFRGPWAAAPLDIAALGLGTDAL
jgi:hypothetical protein